MRLDRGDEIEIIGQDGGFIQVRTPTGEIGWIPSDSLAQVERVQDERCRREMARPARLRTHDLLVRNQMLYPLSYGRLLQWP